MTIGAGVAYSTFWLMCGVSFIAWLWFRAPRHRHKWNEVGNADRMRGDKMVGRRIVCVCEECGEPRSFDV
ncbi:hypothetical protein [Rhizobium phage RHEph18]|nr:hypothetical protein AMJ99_CH01095 [Rhizobium esperanzae]ANM33534.1 hypothetical protein AMK04_CH01096 [Rhizobium sp. N871]QIG73767.1 hypothetical protein EVC05_075 [Rhizobium phage RHph_N2]QXV74485.1 hypothetical protein [Rhizobium phage RHEph18]